ncbi:MAG: hypothetical protein JWL72_2403 [Ilumatobacteraceae bacterium]|nr:hypothetical protein [Ilumatobacteraceae bacterium]
MQTTSVRTSGTDTQSQATAAVDVATDIVQRLTDSWAANDADGFADLYTPTATVVLAGGVNIVGREAIHAFMTAGYAGPMRGSSTANVFEGARTIADGVVVVHTVSKILLAGEIEVPVERHRRATWVVVESGGTWLIEAYTNTPLV